MSLGQGRGLPASPNLTGTEQVEGSPALGLIALSQTRDAGGACLVEQFGGPVSGLLQGLSTTGATPAGGLLRPC